MSLSDGPRPWPESRWQRVAGQLLEQRRAALGQRSFAAAGEPRLIGRGSITITEPIIPEWLVPQYSAQKM